MENIRKKFNNFGLKDKEIDVYFSLLVMGKGTITDISKKSKIKRTSIYQYLDILLEEGLIYQTAIKKRVFYAPENPKKIIKLLESKRDKIEKSQREIEAVMPNLESLYTKTLVKPSISYYEGKEGIKEVYNEMISTNKNIYSFFSPKKLFGLFSYEENDDLLMKLYNNGGILSNLIEKSDETEKRLEIKKYSKFVRNKILPDNFKFDTDLLIGKDSIAMISFDNLISIIIKDKAIADLQKNIFKNIWKSLK